MQQTESLTSLSQSDSIGCSFPSTAPTRNASCTLFSAQSTFKCNTVVSHQLHCIVEHSNAQRTIFQCCFQSVLFCSASRYRGTECNALKTFSWMECSSASNFDQVLRFCGENYPTLLSPLASAQRAKYEKK